MHVQADPNIHINNNNKKNKKQKTKCKGPMEVQVLRIFSAN